MKVIFLKDVPKLGKKDDVKDMNDGYVRNFLLPQKLVEPATPAALEKLSQRKAARETNQAFENAKNETILKSLAAASVTISANANDKGILFKSISAKDIAPLFARELNLDIPESLFKEVHLKTLGEHAVSFVVGGRNGTCKVVVIQK